jgi:hypothetical protein
MSYSINNQQLTSFLQGTDGLHADLFLQLWTLELYLLLRYPSTTSLKNEFT